jgi:2-polyprenyl-6-methoxyphenol hydroxylase-like FAD-dependent oxidoreductase
VDRTFWEATDLADNGDWVRVALQAVVKVPGEPRPVLTDDRKTLRCKFLIGADGANSLTRGKSGIERTDYPFQHVQWLVVDARMLEDPEAPRTVLPLGKRHRRWEWAKLPSETVEELEKPESAWKRLAEFGVTKAIANHSPYCL